MVYVCVCVAYLCACYSFFLLSFACCFFRPGIFFLRSLCLFFAINFDVSIARDCWLRLFTNATQKEKGWMGERMGVWGTKPLGHVRSSMIWLAGWLIYMILRAGQIVYDLAGRSDHLGPRSYRVFN